LSLDTGSAPIEECVDTVVGFLVERGILAERREDSRD